MERWRAIRPTTVFFDNPSMEAVRIPEGGIVLTEDYSPSARRTLLRIEVLPGWLWLDTEQFNLDFERIR